MLKLTCHTAVFGPIDFEFEQPAIRVGRSEDNDLVLRHASVEPHHCLLVFRGEKILWLPPSDAGLWQDELERLEGVEFGPGDSLPIGDYHFVLAHSSKTVAIPPGKPEASAVGPSQVERAQPRYYCAQCRTFIEESDVKRVGLVGRAKRSLCPHCSGVLDIDLEPPERKPKPAPKKGWRQAARSLISGKG